MPLSIACVYNDPEVRRHCLDRSLDAATGGVEFEYLPIDNTEQQFSSAGAALNHAVRLATHDVVVFVHQDVFFHDLQRLETAASALSDPAWGVLGSCGVSATGELAGRLRDRVILIGRSAPTPVPVQTLDEVLFMARRDDLLREPLSEDPQLAWHAYAVEYALRMRAAGRQVGAVDTAITHNSITVNLARLDDAHRHVGTLYPQERPIRTTCGTVTAPKRQWRALRMLREHPRGRTWLRQSLSATRVRAALDVRVVIADIAYEVDLVDYSEQAPLHVVNIDRDGAFAPDAGATVCLERRGRPVVMSSVVRADLEQALGEIDEGDNVLVTGLTHADLGDLSSFVAGRPSLAGVQWSEVWLLGGPGAVQPPEVWSRPGAVPLGAGSALVDR
jgi:hypothetical protein